MNIIKKILFGMFLTSILIIQVQAKWATVSDAPARNSYVQNFTVNSDGTYEVIKEISKVILNEAGRDLATNFVLSYNGDSEKLEIIEAKTIYKGKEYPLDKNLIEDKPLASAFHGFDQRRQILLAFPNIEVGAKIFLKFKLTLQKPPMDDFFASTLYFGAGEFVDRSTINIKSKLPLNILVNDPENHLKVTESKDHLSLRIKLKKPIYKDVTNEPGPIMVRDKYFTWVSVSSIKEWQEFAAKYGKLVTKIFKQKLPKPFKKILEKAKKKKGVIDQINTVTSLLNSKIRYMGDWRSVSGRLIPRDLDKINKSQLGDCKDFSASTAAILSKLGLKAQMVAVLRGTYNLPKNILPSFAAFNHAMVKVTDKNGKIYWVDPTNFSSMAQGTYPDIADKNTLILDENDPSHEKIPPVSFESAGAHVKRELKVLNDNTVLETGSLLLQNESAMGLAGASLKISTDTIKDILFNFLAGNINLEDKHKKGMKLPKLDSRIVKDIAIDYSFVRENDILQTNVGPALKLTYSGSIPAIYNISEDFVAEALVRDYPASATIETTIKNINAKNINSLNKEMKTPWLYAKRECKFDENHDLKIKDTFIFYKKLIPREDFKKKEFVKLKNWLKRNFKDIIIVFYLGPDPSPLETYEDKL